MLASSVVIFILREELTASVILTSQARVSNGCNRSSRFTNIDTEFDEVIVVFRNDVGNCGIRVNAFTAAVPLINFMIQAIILTHCS